MSREIFYLPNKKQSSVDGETNDQGPDLVVGVKNFWDSVEINQKSKTMSLVDCPYCRKRLRVPEAYFGRMTCPSCGEMFNRQSMQNNGPLYDTKGRVSIVTNAHRRQNASSFERILINLGISIILSTILFVVSLIYMISTM